MWLRENSPGEYQMWVAGQKGMMYCASVSSPSGRARRGQGLCTRVVPATVTCHRMGMRMCSLYMAIALRACIWTSPACGQCTDSWAVLELLSSLCMQVCVKLVVSLDGKLCHQTCSCSRKYVQDILVAFERIDNFTVSGEVDLTAASLRVG